LCSLNHFRTPWCFCYIRAHFRLKDLRAAGAWDPFNVTEDADLGFRLTQGGRRAAMIPAPTGEESTTTLKAWTRQRSRWIKGYIQTLLVQGRGAASGRKAASLGLTLFVAVISALAYAPAMLALSLWAAAGWLGLVSGPPLSAGLLPLAGFAAAFASAVPAARRAGDRSLLRAALWQPIFWLPQTIAAVWAIRQLIDQPYYWEKTRHGIADRRPRQPWTPSSPAPP